MPNKKFHLIISGCQMNMSDAERLATALQQLGFQRTDNEEEADLIGIIACSVKQTAVDKIHGKIRNWQLIKTKRPLITLLSGCVLENDRKKLKDKFDIFLDIKNLDSLAADLQAAAPEEKLALPNFFDIKPNHYSKHRAYVPIMTGCNKFCSYCAVPYTRGRETSRPSDSIISEIKKLLEDDYKEIILLGQNVNSYGLDKKSARGGGNPEISFPELLKQIDNLGDHFWLKYLTSHPYDMSDELIEVMKHGQNINPYLHLPVQAGSDEMLKKMNRHYSIAEYTTLIKKVRQAIPDIAISTDIIVGFSGENKKDFQATKKLVKKLKFNLSFTSQYSERIGTTAAKLYPDDISKQTKKDRFNIINDQIGVNAKKYNKKLVHTNQEALIDVVKKTKTGYKNIGKLSNYVAVYIITQEPINIGEFIQVKIIQADSWGVQAELK
ncbi:tRNA (N6-isopentenyl adenosine(37)-C2)-methylthiotransferase MiaB [bacterium]|jgi:tRNA-2-methylthio-N6-dimethylallyladenosine synthase|nr:tRNA (N6-isopentenyl adenosine(37)-C2)-methylthiotransferase MiaB [bacterium]MBT4648880.1 tRNA (N6-isopentenyl adenosine(37)-C2)-methylthiotransferase MiaB [bacterium]